MKSQSAYALCFDQLKPDGKLHQERIIKFADLKSARKAYRAIVGSECYYTLAHDRIVGPDGEVYETSESV